jgi:PAS domain S-box-containing protein
MPDQGQAAPRLKTSARAAAAERRRIPEFGLAGRRLVALLAAVLMLLTVAFVAITWLDHQASIEDGWTTAERAALGAAEHASRGLGAARLVTDRVADGVRVEGPGAFRGQRHAELASMMRDAPQIVALSVLDPQGRIISSSLAPDPVAAGAPERPQFVRTPTDAMTQTAPLRFERLHDGWVFTYIRQVREPHGGLIGVVIAVLRATEFERFQRGLGLGAGGVIGLFRAEDGAPLMLSPLPPDPSPATAPPASAVEPPRVVLEAAMAGVLLEGRFQRGLPDGDTLLAAWRLSDAGERVVATAAIPRSAAVAAFRTRLLRNALLFGIGAGVVAMLGAAVGVAIARGARIRGASEAARRELAAVLEASGDDVLALDSAWRITFVNERATESIARGRELRGQVLWDAFPETVGSPFAAACRRSMEGRVAASAEADLRSLGRRFRVESHPRTDGGIVLFFRDVTNERAAAARIAESEARFRAMADNIPQLAWMARPDGWIFWFNRRWFDYTGTGQTEVEGWGWRIVHHPEHMDRVLEGFARAVERGYPWEDTFPIRGADGSFRWFLSRAMPVRDAEGRIALWFGTNTDVTEQRAAQAALRESEAQLRRVLDNLYVFVAVLAPDGTLLEVNHAPLEAAGLVAGDVQGKAFWDCFWWSHDAVARSRLRDSCARAAGGEAARYDAEMRVRGDGRMTVDLQVAPLTDAAGRVTHLIASATDVTAQRAAEHALAESEARLRLAQEAAEVGVFERDLKTDRAHWSSAMFRLYGIEPPGGDGRMGLGDYLALLHPADRAAQHAKRDAMLADPAQSRFSFEYRIRRADDGEIRWLATRGEVVRDAAGKAVLVRGVAHDITDRRRAEERQMLLAREVDHRAKNALAVVQSIVGLTRNPDPEQFRRAVTGRIAAMARAHTLLAREGWDGAELRELIGEEVAPHRAFLPDGAERVALNGPPVALAPGAAQPLAMALHELATNAAKYGALSVPTGQVEVAWEPLDSGGLELRWIERGGPVLDGAPAHRGFGSSVIRNTVERQLGGKVVFEWPASGLRCTLRLSPQQVRWPEVVAGE